MHLGVILLLNDMGGGQSDAAAWSPSSLLQVKAVCDWKQMLH